MGLMLIFLIFKLHFVLSTQQLHEYADTNLPHFKTRSHLSIADPPTRSYSYVPSSIAQPPIKSSPSVPTSIALPPSKSTARTPTKKWKHSNVDSIISHHKHHYSERKNHNPTPGPTYPIQAPTYSHQGPSVFKAQPPFSSPKINFIHAPAPAPSPAFRSSHFDGSSLNKIKTPPPAYTLVLPPPSPNKDCLSITCLEPLTYTPPGSPCGCIWPLQVKLRVSISIYKCFPLVSKLAKEIAARSTKER